MRVEDCPFCDRETRLDDIVYESDNFFVLVGIGLAVPGHTMLITKDHYPCFAALPPEIEDEYQAVRDEFLPIYREAFSEPFIMECGVWGQSVPHAHQHIIPLKGEDYEIESIVDETIAKSGLHYEEMGFDELKDFYRETGEYFSWEEHGKIVVCHVKGVEPDKANSRRNVRAYFQTYHGVEGAGDWRKMTEEDYRLDNERRDITRKRLKSE